MANGKKVLNDTDKPNLSLSFMMSPDDEVMAVRADLEGGSAQGRLEAGMALNGVLGDHIYEDWDDGDDIPQATPSSGKRSYTANWNSKHPKASTYQPSGSAWRNNKNVH